MVQKFRQTFRVDLGYVPSQRVTGEANRTIYRGKNMLLRGGVGDASGAYAEAFRGWSNGGFEPFGYGVKDTVNTFTQTLSPSDHATTEMVLIPGGPTNLSGGATILINNKLYVVRSRYLEQNYIIAPADTTLAAWTSYRPRIIQELDGDICTMTGGSVIRLPLGHLIGVGAGTVYINNTSTGLALTEQAKIAIKIGSGAYAIYNLGLSKPAKPTVAPVNGGVQNMQAGTYSVRIARGRSQTVGYGNPSDAAEVTLVTTQMIRVTFPAMDTANGQDTWVVFGTRFSVDEGIEGPWYLHRYLDVGDVSPAGGTVDFEWRNQEIESGDLATFDNDPPPPAAFMTMLGGIPLLLGCGGAPPDDLMTMGDYFPGPVMRPCRPGNPEAYPAASAVAVSPPEDIIGFVEGQGRLYVMTRNRLHIVTLTGDPEQPITVRPFWRTGFASSRALCFANGDLYGFTSRGPVRSSGDVDMGDEDHLFASPVATEMEDWDASRTTLFADPYNEMILYCHANDAQNLGGYWQSKVLAYSPRLNAWSPPIIIDSNVGHMVVSSGAAIAERTYFIANDAVYRWDDGEAPIAWFIATPFCDQGSEGLDKTVTGFSATFRGSAVTAGVFGGGSEENIPVTALETANAASDSGAINLGSPSGIKNSKYVHLNLREKRMYAVRVEGIFTGGDGDRDRVDEMIVEGNVILPRH